MTEKLAELFEEQAAADAAPQPKRMTPQARRQLH
jgi:hypothetical protein